MATRRNLSRRGRAALIAAGLAGLAAIAGVATLSTLPIAEARTSATGDARLPVAATTPSAASADQATEGKQVYATTCVACHQLAGEGMPEVYPPLAGSEWVTGDPANLVRIVLHGMTGPVEVQGESFQGVMPPWGGMLKDDAIAAVSTYIRSSWGNKAPPVTSATVARVRASHAQRTTMWTAAELTKLAKK